MGGSRTVGTTTPQFSRLGTITRFSRPFDQAVSWSETEPYRVTRLQLPSVADHGGRLLAGQVSDTHDQTGGLPKNSEMQWDRQATVSASVRLRNRNVPFWRDSRSLVGLRHESGRSSQNDRDILFHLRDSLRTPDTGPVMWGQHPEASFTRGAVRQDGICGVSVPGCA